MILKDKMLHVCRDEYRRAISNLEILKIKKRGFQKFAITFEILIISKSRKA